MSRLTGILSILFLAAAVSPLAVVPSGSSLQKRGAYTQAFAANGDGNDASVQGAGYLTFTRLDSYDLPTCEAWCDAIAACAFINLFNEYNSDATYNPQVKCVGYAVPHTAADKTNSGGQQLLAPPAGTTYITDSVGYTSDAFANPPTPASYTLIFGPIGGATEADGLMETHSLSFYDTVGCATLCNQATNPSNQICEFFNIWLGVQNGNPSYNCALYSVATDASTATNTGQDSLEVTNSRGYARIVDLITDGGFEELTPDCTSSFCVQYGDDYWSTQGNAALNYLPNSGEAHSGQAFVFMFGDSVAITYSNTLNTVPGHDYLLTWWMDNIIGDPITMAILWNGEATSATTFSHLGWVQYSARVAAVGSDTLGFVTLSVAGSDVGFYYLDDVSLVPA